MTRLLSAALLLSLGAAQSACSAQDRTPASPDAPDTSASLQGKLTLPAGFKAGYFARGVDGVRFMALGPDGAVYASQPRAGRVVRILDVNGDGVADSIVPAVTGLDRPHGLAFHQGHLYIANTGGVVRVKLGPDGRATGTPEQLNSYDAGGGHWTRSIAFGADGAMYVSSGSTCNICIEKDSTRATVMRFDEHGKNGRIFARGLRNAVGVVMHPETKEIWVSVNERDNIAPDHQDMPPEKLHILKDGGDYGWPYCYSHQGKPVPNPEYGDAARCSSTIPAALEMQAHSAPLGMTFLDKATNFPEDYRRDLLVAFHGSWNRSVPTGAKVVRVRVQGGKPVSYEDFVTGWQTANGSRWGRPVDVLVYKDGSVLISDDRGGTIVRVYR